MMYFSGSNFTVRFSFALVLSVAVANRLDDGGKEGEG